MSKKKMTHRIVIVREDDWFLVINTTLGNTYKVVVLDGNTRAEVYANDRNSPEDPHDKVVNARMSEICEFCMAAKRADELLASPVPDRAKMN